MTLILQTVSDQIVLRTGDAPTTDISDLPPVTGALDADDKIPVQVDGVWSLGDVADLTVTSASGGFAVTSGGNAFTGEQSWDLGTDKVLIDASGGVTRLSVFNDAETLGVSISLFAGSPSIVLRDVALWSTVSGQVAFLTGRLVPTVTATTGNAPTWNPTTCQRLVVTSITGTVNLSTNFTAGTPASGEVLYVSLTGNGTHSITWPSAMEASATHALPTALSGSGVRLDVTFIYNTATSKWRCINVA